MHFVFMVLFLSFSSQRFYLFLSSSLSSDVILFFFFSRVEIIIFIERLTRICKVVWLFSQENEIDANVLTPPYLISRDKFDKLCCSGQIQK